MSQIDIERTALRSRMLGGIRADDEGAELQLAGWVHRRRDLGGLVFLDLRDRSGLVQVSLGPDWTDATSLELAHRLGAEDVVQVVGSVVVRPRENWNAEIPTGEIEVRATGLRRLADADTPALSHGLPQERQLGTVKYPECTYGCVSSCGEFCWIWKNDI